MRSPRFKTRLWLGQVVVLAAMVAVAAFGAEWALRRAVIGEIIDDAILSLASTEAAALQSDLAHPRVHEVAASAGPPSFVRLDKFVQITNLDGGVVGKSGTLGTARLPTPTRESEPQHSDRQETSRRPSATGLDSMMRP